MKYTAIDIYGLALDCGTSGALAVELPQSSTKPSCWSQYQAWWIIHHSDGSVQERCNSIANALELHLSCTDPSILCFTPGECWHCEVDACHRVPGLLPSNRPGAPVVREARPDPAQVLQGSCDTVWYILLGHQQGELGGKENIISMG